MTDRESPTVGDVGYDVVRETRFRKVAAKRLRQSHTEKPPVTVHRSIPAESMLDWLQAQAEGTPASSRSLLTAGLVLLVARTLRNDPRLNARREEDELRRFSTPNIAVAMATPGGLVAPTIRDPESLGLHGIARRVAELAEAARGGRLSPDDLADATFTITSLGRWGVEYFTPIINPPQIAILGVGALTPALRLVSGQVVEQTLLPLSLTFDHAEVDGVDGAEFLVELVRHATEPS